MPASSVLCRPHGAHRLPARRSSTRRTAALVALFLAALLFPTAAAADPLASRQAQAASVLAEIRGLDASVSRTVDAYNGARIRLDEIREDQARNRRYLAVARASFRRAQQTLQARVLELYTSDNPTGIEVLLGAESLEDLLARAETVRRVTSQDTRVVADIVAFGKEVKRRRAELERARAEQEEVVAELAARRREIEAKLAERHRGSACGEPDGHPSNRLVRGRLRSPSVCVSVHLILWRDVETHVPEGVDVDDAASARACSVGDRGGD